VALRGATEGSRYKESTVEERVCCGVAERCVFRRAIWFVAGGRERDTGSERGVDVGERWCSWDAIAP